MIALVRLLARFSSLYLLACTAAFAQYEERLPIPVARALKLAALPPSAVAVVVQEVGSFQPRVSLNAAAAMNPASLMKLLTTYAALDSLGPAYRWKTEAWLRGPLADGVLEGDLYLKGGGDPKLTLEQFWLLLRELRARGLREVRGDLVLDRSLFAADDYAVIDDQPLRAYNVTPDALLLNFKAVRLSFLPDAERKSVAVLAEPLPEPLQIANSLKLNGNGCGDWKENLKLDYAPASGRLTLAGSFPLSCGEKSINLGLLPHPQYVAGVFRSLWQELGGRIGGGLRSAPLPAEARLFASIESPALAEVIRDINKYSNNVMARQLFLTLGAESARRNGGGVRASDAEQALRDWLAGRDLSFPELVLDNGSGLSRRERISAENLTRLLALAWKSPLMPEFLASLPLTAIDGTMKKRLRENAVAGQAHIKTGSLEGVKGIAGYVLDRGGKWQMVVFLVNHANAAAAQAAQDALLAWVYARGA